LLALRRGRERSVGRRATAAWAACTVGWVITLYCHATAALFVLSCSLVALLRIAVEPLQRFRFFVSFCIANVLALLLYSPWLFRLARQVSSFHGAFWAVFPTTERAAAEIGATFFHGEDPWRWLVIGVLALAGTVRLRRQPLVLAALWSLSLLGPGLVLL